jgi:hypothetical protein
VRDVEFLISGPFVPGLSVIASRFSPCFGHEISGLDEMEDSVIWLILRVEF